MRADKCNSVAHYEKQANKHLVISTNVDRLWKSIKIGQMVGQKEVIQKTNNLLVLKIANKIVSYNYNDFYVLYSEKVKL
jgi:hypothetical protein